MRLCARRAREGGSKPSGDLLCAWGGGGGSHIVREDADTQADGWPFRLLPRVPIYSGNRNSAPGRGRRKSRSPLGSGLAFSWIQDAMKRLRVQLSWQGCEERWSKSPATAVLSPAPCAAMPGCAQTPYMVQSKTQIVRFFDA